LKNQLAQLCWAGELGRLADRTQPKWHLVADPVNGREWENLLREALGEPVQMVKPHAARWNWPRARRIGARRRIRACGAFARGIFRALSPAIR
jgi:hypothetical protein